MAIVGKTKNPSCLGSDLFLASSVSYDEYHRFITRCVKNTYLFFSSKISASLLCLLYSSTGDTRRNE